MNSRHVKNLLVTVFVYALFFIHLPVFSLACSDSYANLYTLACPATAAPSTVIDITFYIDKTGDGSGGGYKYEWRSLWRGATKLEAYGTDLGDCSTTSPTSWRAVNPTTPSAMGPYTYTIKSYASTSTTEPNWASVTLDDTKSCIVTVVPTVSISAGSTSLETGSSTTLTATASQTVTDTLYYIKIYEGTTQLTSCTSGSTCSVSVSSSTAITRTFVAKVTGAGGTPVLATSSTVSVTWTAPACTPSWSCTVWTPAESGYACGTDVAQTRTCTDANSCGTTSGKPKESQTIKGTLASWSYGTWTPAASGYACGTDVAQTRTCTDANSCGYACPDITSRTVTGTYCAYSAQGQACSGSCTPPNTAYCGGASNLGNIGAGGSLSGSPILSAAIPDRWYYFYATGNQLLTMTLTSPSSSDYDGYIYSGSCDSLSMLSFCIDDTSPETCTFTPSASTYYFARVHRVSGSGTGSFSLVMAAADTTPPVRSAGAPSGTVTGSSQTLSLTTADEAATCRWSQTSGITYDNMVSTNNPPGYTFTTTGSTSHSSTISTTSTGTYDFYVRCKDGAATPNKNTDDYHIQFVVDFPPTASLSLSKNTPIALGNSIILSTSATDDYGVAKIYFYDPDNTVTTGDPETTDIANWHMLTCTNSPTSCTKTWTVTPTAGSKTYKTKAKDTNNVLTSESTAAMSVVDACANWVCPALSAGDKTTGLPTISSAQYVNYVDCTTTCTCPTGYKIEVTATGKTEEGYDYFSLVGECAGKYTSDSGTFNYLYKGCGTQSAGLRFTSDLSTSGSDITGSGVSATKLSCIISDTTPPTITASSPSNSVSNPVTMTVTTDEGATCKYSAAQNTLYKDMNGVFTTASPYTSHSVSFGTMTTGAKNVYVRCQDRSSALNTMESDYKVSFTVIGAPTLDSPSDGGIVTTLTPTLSWYAAASVNCYDLQIYDGATKIYDGSAKNPQEFVSDPPGPLSYNVPSSLLSWQKTYTWKLWPSATSCTSWGSVGPDWTFNTRLPAPALTAPSDTASVTETPTLQWDRSGDANCYKVEIDRPGTTQYTATKSSSGVTVSYTVPSGTLTQGQTYTWRIKPSNDNCAAYGTTSNERTFSVGAACTDVNNPCDIPLTLVGTSGGHGVYNGGGCQNPPQSCIKSLISPSWGYWKFTMPVQYGSDPSYQTNLIGWRDSTALTGSVKIGTTPGGNDVCDWFPICTTSEILCQGTKCYKGLDPGKTYYATIGGTSGSAQAWVSVAATSSSCGVLTPFTDAITVGACSTTLKYYAYDLNDETTPGDLGAGRYKDLGLSGTSRTIEFDDAPSGGCDMDVKFKETWSVSGNTITMKNEISDYGASHVIYAGYQLSSSNCKIISCTPISLGGCAESVFAREKIVGVGTQSVTHVLDGMAYDDVRSIRNYETDQLNLVECLPDENTNAAGYNNFCVSKDSSKPYCDPTIKKCEACS
ncbi:MAG: hypothetical protein V1836_04495, partial [Candidatus Aenigmatarchaeota archaeon]